MAIFVAVEKSAVVDTVAFKWRSFEKTVDHRPIAKQRLGTACFLLCQYYLERTEKTSWTFDACESSRARRIGFIQWMKKHFACGKSVDYAFRRTASRCVLDGLRLFTSSLLGDQSAHTAGNICHGVNNPAKP